MTISREDRARDRHNALLSMMTSLGAQAIDAVNFPSFEPPLSEVKRTTWDDLVDVRFVEVVSRWNGNTYALTGKGWYAGLKATGKINDPTFRQDMSRLSAALKDAVKGRHKDAFVYVSDVATQRGLSEDFIYNAVESRLLDREFGGYGAEWEVRAAKRGTMIRVPVRFGMERLTDV